MIKGLLLTIARRLLATTITELENEIKDKDQTIKAWIDYAQRYSDYVEKRDLVEDMKRWESPSPDEITIVDMFDGEVFNMRDFRSPDGSHHSGLSHEAVERVTVGEDDRIKAEELKKFHKMLEPDSDLWS